MLNNVLFFPAMLSCFLERIPCQEYYEAIALADLYGALQVFLTHPHTDIRSRACNAVGNMCRHSPYFYPVMVGTRSRLLSTQSCKGRKGMEGRDK